MQSGQVSNLLERKISQDIWSGLPSGPHGPRGLDTVCWAAATPAGYNRGSLEGAEGTTGQLCLCTPQRGRCMWPLLQTNESLLSVFFFSGITQRPKNGSHKTSCKGSLQTVIFLCFSQIVFFSLHKPVVSKLVDMMGCVWRTSAASLEAGCPCYSLTAGPTP